MSALYSIHLSPALRKHLAIGQFSLFSLFLCFSFVTINRQPHMTPVSFIKTKESYEVSFVTIIRQTSFDSGILRQDYGSTASPSE